jgi:hypothetical protein
MAFLQFSMAESTSSKACLANAFKVKSLSSLGFCFKALQVTFHNSSGTLSQNSTVSSKFLFWYFSWAFLKNRSQSGFSISYNHWRIKMDLKNLLPPSFEESIHKWLQEDIPAFDYGGYVVGTNLVEALLYCKSPGVLAGKPFFDAVFKHLGCGVKWLVAEGAFINPYDESIYGSSSGRVAVAEVIGPANKLLQGERLALNIIARASGIATRARNMVEIAKKMGWNGRIAGTRKTTPGFRLVEKYAMTVGTYY